MTKNPKNKKNFIGNLKQIIARGSTYIFPENTVMQLYYWGSPADNLMREIRNIDGKLIVTAVVNDNIEEDLISDFSFDEVKAIYDFVINNPR